LGWDALTTNKNNRTLCVSAQLKPKNAKSDLDYKKESNSSSKKANISRILLLISSRPSKKVLVKSKSYKDKGKNPNKHVNI